jgi:hypothetical protein
MFDGLTVQHAAAVGRFGRARHIEGQSEASVHVIARKALGQRGVMHQEAPELRARLGPFGSLHRERLQRGVPRHAFDVFKGQPGHAVALARVQERDQIRVMQGGHDLGFAVKALDALLFPVAQIAQHLKRDLAPKPLVHREIHQPHPAAPEGLEQAVLTQLAPARLFQTDESNFDEVVGAGDQARPRRSLLVQPTVQLGLFAAHGQAEGVRKQRFKLLRRVIRHSHQKQLVMPWAL